MTADWCRAGGDANQRAMDKLIAILIFRIGSKNFSLKMFTEFKTCFTFASTCPPPFPLDQGA
jgi:hypothetical protein